MESNEAQQNTMRPVKFVLPLLLVSVCVPMRKERAHATQDSRADFATRCKAPGVVRCIGFDSASEVKPHLDTAWDDVYRAEVVRDVKASGAGSLRFTIPPHSPANTSGLFWMEFSDDLKTQFGPGEDFYVQWRQRFSPEMINTEYKGGNGVKQAIIG